VVTNREEKEEIREKREERSGWSWVGSPELGGGAGGGGGQCGVERGEREEIKSEKENLERF